MLHSMSEEPASGDVTLASLRAEWGENYHIYYSYTGKFGALRLKGPTKTDPLEAATAGQLETLIRADYEEYSRMQDTGLNWQPSPSSNPSGNCPQYADLPDGGKAIRDDRDPGTVVTLTAGGWEALKADVIGGLTR
jgi:Domain of unknown function (DUF397)